MSLAAFTRPVFGPAKLGRLALMGIRFNELGGDGSGAGGDGTDDKGGFNAPADQAALDKIIEARLSRERAATAEKYKGYTPPAAPKPLAPVVGAADAPDLDAIREEVRAEERAIFALERVDNALKAALNGRALDPNVLLLGFDKKQFSGTDGVVDTAAITKWVTDHSAEVKTGNGRDPGQGGRGATSTGGSVQAGRDLYDDTNKKPTRKE